MKALSLIIAILLLAMANNLLGDDNMPYDNERIIYDNGKVLLYYTFNWDKCLKHRNNWVERYGMDHFGKQNDYGRLVSISKMDGSELFSIPICPLNYLWASQDSRYVVALSEVKFINPTQLIILDDKGNRIIARGISKEYAKLTPDEYVNFAKQFPDSKISPDLVERRNGSFYIDYSYLGLSGQISDDAVVFLRKKSVESHFSHNITESATNWINWYRYYNPDINLKENTTKGLISISLLDPKGERMTIFLESQPPPMPPKNSSE